MLIVALSLLACDISTNPAPRTIQHPCGICKKLPGKINQIKNEGYSVLKKDRNKNGGGVSIYYKDELVAYEETELLSSNEMIESVWLNIVSQSQTWLIGCIYRSPDNNLFFEIFQEIVERIWMKRKILLLVGDLNCDLLLKGKSKDQKALGKKLNRILEVHGSKMLSPRKQEFRRKRKL